jgi:hypothetical protein
MSVFDSIKNQPVGLFLNNGQMFAVKIESSDAQYLHVTNALAINVDDTDTGPRVSFTDVMPLGKLDEKGMDLRILHSGIGYTFPLAEALENAYVERTRSLVLARG